MTGLEKPGSSTHTSFVVPRTADRTRTMAFVEVSRCIEPMTMFLQEPSVSISGSQAQRARIVVVRAIRCRMAREDAKDFPFRDSPGIENCSGDRMRRLQMSP